MFQLQLLLAADETEPAGETLLAAAKAGSLARDETDRWMTHGFGAVFNTQENSVISWR